MALSLTAVAKNARLDALTTQIGNAAKVRIYSGSAPANADAALSGNTLLGELTGGTPFAPAASGGVLTANSITQDSSADATGTASFFRVLTSGDVVKAQGTVTATGGGGDMTLNTVSIVAGGPIQVTSFTITDGN